MRQRHIILIAVLMTLLPSCILEMEVTPAQPDTVELTLCGDIVVPQSALGEDITQTKADVVPTIESLRVLVFDASGSLVSNTLFNSGWTGPQWSEDDNAYISSISGSEQGRNQILASVGTNYVYLVVNESVGGENLVSQLKAVQSKTVMDNDIRTTKVEYTDLIPVNDAAEPPFLMCVYDEVTVLGGQVTPLDITGLSTRNAIYGFPMRRTMAKIILDSVTGGVEVNGNIVGTEIPWDGNASVDQIPGDTGNDKLKATSAIHILGLELVNVPKYYSWEQNKDKTYPTYSPELGYRADPIPVASSEYIAEYNYFGRAWGGDITVSGLVPFTRVDALADFWKTEVSAGGNAYAVIFEDQVPDTYFIWSIDQTITQSQILGWSLSYANPDKSVWNNYEYYRIDSNGKVCAYNNSDVQISGDAPNDHFNLNSGNFIDFYKNQYWEENNYRPGKPVAGIPEMGEVVIDPAVWQLNFDKRGYYIPENVSSSTEKRTILRIKASIATASASFTDEEVQGLIDQFMNDNPGYVGDLVQDEGHITLDKKNIDKFLWVKGKLIPNAKDPNAYAIQYGGLQRSFSGKTSVANKQGNYQAIIGNNINVITIDVPLNNGEFGSGDNNIYRGREYHVNLYFTDGIDPATRSGEDTNSVTFNVDGQEYALTASVSVK